ncbi:hypothetical protein, partial [Mesorhizobium sp.]|uniref:hypothetical protein n=1 Tax=Mesorhizobium sp. TaxID=1871066 RepID=UPI0025C25227
HTTIVVIPFLPWPHVGEHTGVDHDDLAVESLGKARAPSNELISAINIIKALSAITAPRMTLQMKPFYACPRLPGRDIADLWLSSLRPPQATPSCPERTEPHPASG